MDFNDYQKKAIETAIYPVQYSILYPALGLCGESGEVAEKIKKLIRDESGLDNISDESRDLIKKELGDVLWYLANLSLDLGYTLEEVAESNLDKLRKRMNQNQIHGSGDVRENDPKTSSESPISITGYKTATLTSEIQTVE